MRTPTIVHISDPHVADPRRGDGADQRLRRLLETIAENEDPDRTVICDTGDLGWSMTRREADKIKESFRPVNDFRSIHAKGNHDTGPLGLAYREAAGDRWREIVRSVGGYDPGAPTVKRFGDVVFIAANTAHDSTILARGGLGEEQIEEVKEVARKIRDGGLIGVLLFHHCPSGGDPTKRLSDREELTEALQDVGKVSLMLTGHLHQDREWADVHGARRLFSSDVCTDTMRYRRIGYDNDRGFWESEWIEAKSD